MNGLFSSLFMKNYFLAFALSLVFTGSVLAGDIQNLEVLPTGTETLIQWTGVSEENLFGVDGYALQWGEQQSNIRNDKSVRQFLSPAQTSLAIRSAGLNYNTDYFFRVYTYKKEGRQTILTNGSKILKWNKAYNGEIALNVLEPNDVELSELTSSGTSEEFGVIRVTRYDTYGVFSWSRPNLATNEYDGFAISLSTSNDFSNPIVTVHTGKNDFKGRVNGLTPLTEYFARGYFYKTRAGEKLSFGAGQIRSFKTTAQFSAAQVARMDRLRRMGKVKDRVSPTATGWIPGTENAVETTTAASSTSSSSSTTTSSTTTASTGTKGASRTQVKARIAEVEKQIRTLQVELRRLQTDLRKASSSSTTSSTSSRTQSRTSSRSSVSSRKSPRTSLAERLKALKSRSRSRR